MNTQTMNGYTDNKIKVANANKQLIIAKSLNRPVIMLRRGVTGDMHHNKTATPCTRNLTMMERAKEDRDDALKLFESGITFSEISKKLRKSRNTINNYFKYWVSENGEDWGKQVKTKRDGKG